MIKFSRHTDVVDTHLYDKYLNCRGYILYDRELMMKKYANLKQRGLALADYARDVMKYNSGMKFRRLEKEFIIDYLIEHEHCQESSFSLKGRNSLSLDKEKVLKPLYSNGYAQEFLELFMSHKSIMSRCSDAQSILNKCKDIGFKSHYGKELSPINFKASEQVNRRFNYKDIDIISQVSSEFKECISVQNGYFLAFGDFAQSDLRIAYNLLLRDSTNIDVMNSVEDKYEGIARLIARDKNKIFDLEKFKKERDLYKVYILKVLYGTKGATNSREYEFISALRAYLEKCEKYVEYKRRLNEIYDANIGASTTSYFGFKQKIRVFNRIRDSFLNYALNAPVQTGTSEIVILTVCKILDKFYSLGYSEDDVSVYFVRHDEPIFRLSEKAIKDLWVFKNAETIIVDDWMPLKLEFKFGYNYKVVDNKLMELAQKNYFTNKDKIEIYEPSGNDSIIYYPINKTLKFYYHQIKYDGNTIVAIQNKDYKLVNFFKIKSTEDSSVNATIISHVERLALKFKQKFDVNLVLVYSNFIEGDKYIDGLLLKYKKVQNLELYEAQAFVEKMINNISKENIYRDKVIANKEDYTDFNTYFNKEVV